MSHPRNRTRSIKTRPVHKVAALVIGIAGTPMAYAHHGADPASELPLWQMIGIAVVVLLGFVAVNAIRKWFGHRQPQPGNARREEEPIP